MSIRHLDNTTIQGTLSASSNIITSGSFLSAGKDLITIINAVSANNSAISLLPLSSITPNGYVVAPSGTFGIDSNNNLWFKQSGNSNTGWETIFLSTSGQYYADFVLQDASNVILNYGELGLNSGNLTVGDGNTLGGNPIGSNAGLSFSSPFFNYYVNSAIGYDNISRLQSYAASTAFSAINGFTLPLNTPGIVWASTNSVIFNTYNHPAYGVQYYIGGLGNNMQPSTGYLRGLLWDGTLTQPYSGTTSIRPYIGSVSAVNPYLLQQKAFAYFPCTSAGLPSGYFSNIRFTSSNLTSFIYANSAALYNHSDVNTLSAVPFTLLVNSNQLTDMRISGIDDFSYISYASNYLTSISSFKSIYSPSAGPYTDGRTGIELYIDSLPLTTLPPLSNIRYLGMQYTGIKNFVAGPYTVYVRANGTPVTSIDFSNLLSTSLPPITGNDSLGSYPYFLFPNANMTTQAVDAAFNSFSTSFLQVATARGMGITITGTSGSPSNNSLPVRNLILSNPNSSIFTN